MGSNQKNAFIIVEPDYEPQLAFGPLKSLLKSHIKTHICPIDPRLSYLEANHVVNEIKPRYLVLPSHYDINADNPKSGIVARDGIFPIEHAQSLKVPIKAKKSHATIQQKVALGLKPSPIQKFETQQLSTKYVGLVQFQAKLEIGNYDFVITDQKAHRLDLLGKPSLQYLQEALQAKGITDATVDINSKNETCVTIVSLRAKVIISNQQTHIIAESESNLKLLKSIFQDSK